MKNFYALVRCPSRSIRIALLLLPAFPIVNIAKAQVKLEPQVIAVSGGFASNGSYTHSYTIGEMGMVQTFSAGNTILTQGFQQPVAEELTGIMDLTKEDDGSFAVYPNPAVDRLSFGFELTGKGKVVVELYTALGQKVADLCNHSYGGGKELYNLDVTTYAAGTYLMVLKYTPDNSSKPRLMSRTLTVVR